MKIKKSRLPNPIVFLLAAEMMLTHKESNDSYWNQEIIYLGRKLRCSLYSCDNINAIVDNNKFYNESNWYESPEYYFFEKLYKQPERGGQFGWWPDLDNGEHDHESRIYAALFAYEFAKDMKNSNKLKKRVK